jgi:UV DNA damage endonuclease
VLENDDIRFSAADVVWVHEQTGVRLIFDFQHFWCLNPEGLEMTPTLAKMLATWPEGERPKIHFSTPRTELRELVRTDPKTRKKTTALLPPVLTNHADFVNPFEFIRFMRDARDFAFDVMLESKSKDLALLKLRTDLVRHAPDVAQRFGLGVDAIIGLGEEEALPTDLAADDLDPDEGARSLPNEARL